MPERQPYPDPGEKSIQGEAPESWPDRGVPETREQEPDERRYPDPGNWSEGAEFGDDRG